MTSRFGILPAPCGLGSAGLANNVWPIYIWGSRRSKSVRLSGWPTPVQVGNTQFHSETRRYPGFQCFSPPVDRTAVMGDIVFRVAASRLVTKPMPRSANSYRHPRRGDHHRYGFARHPFNCALACEGNSPLADRGRDDARAQGGTGQHYGPTTPDGSSYFGSRRFIWTRIVAERSGGWSSASLGAAKR